MLYYVHILASRSFKRIQAPLERTLRFFRDQVQSKRYTSTATCMILASKKWLCNGFPRKTSSHNDPKTFITVVITFGASPLGTPRRHSQPQTKGGHWHYDVDLGHMQYIAVLCAPY